MAVDAYLQIEGIKGESMDDKHKDWIECLDVDFGVDQPRSPVASTAGGHTSARAEFDEVVVSKLADLATPILLQHCAMGKTIPKAKFEFFPRRRYRRTGQVFRNGARERIDRFGEARLKTGRWYARAPVFKVQQGHVEVHPAED
jgi:type VI secretion system Hcp family effector